MSPWGLARIEVIAAKEYIESELLCGVPMKQIHDALTQSGRVTVTYNSFRRQIQPIRDKLKMTSGDHANHATLRTSGQEIKPIPQPKADRKSSARFQFNPSCKPDDFF